MQSLRRSKTRQSHTDALVPARKNLSCWKNQLFSPCTGVVLKTVSHPADLPASERDYFSKARQNSSGSKSGKSIGPRIGFLSSMGGSHRSGTASELLYTRRDQLPFGAFLSPLCLAFRPHHLCGLRCHWGRMPSSCVGSLAPKKSPSI